MSLKLALMSLKLALMIVYFLVMNSERCNKPHPQVKDYGFTVEGGLFLEGFLPVRCERVYFLGGLSFGRLR